MYQAQTLVNECILLRLLDSYSLHDRVPDGRTVPRLLALHSVLPDASIGEALVTPHLPTLAAASAEEALAN